jgi:hypothetical protein
MKCGADDPRETALALNWCVFEYDEEGKPTGYHYDTPEHEFIVALAMECPVEDAK